MIEPLQNADGDKNRILSPYSPQVSESWPPYSSALNTPAGIKGEAYRRG